MTQKNTNLVNLNLSDENKNKFKDEIKTKLIQIGALVDDELPLYIMIMLANKKSEKQISEDLKPFLHDNSSKFSAWLYSIFNQMNDSVSQSCHEMREKSKTIVTREKKENSNEQNEPELAIQIESNEFNEEDDQSRSKSDLSINDIAQKIKEKRIALDKQKQEEDKIRQKLLKKSSSKDFENKKTNSLSKSSESDNLFKRKSITSRVGAVIKHETNESSETKYNPHKPMVGNVASVIKVSERKYSLPKSLQPNKSILLKAVDAANSSVNKKEKSPKNTKPSIKSRLGAKKVKTDDDSENHSHHDEPVYDRRKIEITEESHEKLENKIEETIEKAAGVNTKFIVTLKGIDESKFFNKTETQEATLSLKRRLSEDDDEMEEEEELSQEEEMNVDEEFEGDELNQQKRFKIRCSFWPSCDKGTECPYLHPNKSCEAFPNCKFGNSCHYIHPSCRFDGFCTRTDCIYTHMIKKSPILVPIQEPAIKQSIGLPTAPVTNKPVLNKTLFNPIMKAKSKFALNHIGETENKAKIPIECKFGKTCKNPLCIYNHSFLPKKSALKWIANKQNATLDQTNQTQTSQQLPAVATQ